MGRTPLPPDTVFKALNLRQESFAHLKEVAARSLGTVSEAMNLELAFLRTWGLAPSRLRRLRAAAAKRKRSEREFLQEVVHDAGLGLSPAKPKARTAAKREGVHRTSMNISGPNAALVEREAAAAGVSFSAMVDRLLEFARGFGLHADILAAIDRVAAVEGDSRREVIERMIREAVEGLPPG
jgi:hypothetical protein